MTEATTPAVTPAVNGADGPTVDDLIAADAAKPTPTPDKAPNAKEASAKALKAQQAAEEKMLIAMVRLGHEPIKVHPTCVDAHVRIGWTVKAGE